MCSPISALCRWDWLGSDILLLLTQIKLKELQRSGSAALFFNVLFNLNKYAQMEMRDPFSAMQARETPHLT